MSGMHPRGLPPRVNRRRFHPSDPTGLGGEGRGASPASQLRLNALAGTALGRFLYIDNYTYNSKIFSKIFEKLS